MFIGLFSLTLITIVVAIVRAVSISATRQGAGNADTTSLWLWSAVQAPLGMQSYIYLWHFSKCLADIDMCPYPVAVVISCLSAFPLLFKRGKERQKPANTPTDTYYERVRSRMKAIAKQTSNPHSPRSIVQMPSQSLAGYRGSGSLKQEHTLYAASYDSLEMPPESPEQAQQYQKPEQVIGITADAFQQNSLAAPTLKGWLDNGASLPKSERVTEHGN